jgi:hypothetical protein
MEDVISVSPEDISKLKEELAKMFETCAGVKKFHWHAARHWCATALLKGYRGAKPLDIRYVQIHMGHKSLRTTQRYTHITSQEAAEEVMNRLAGIFQGDGIMIEKQEICTELHGGDNFQQFSCSLCKGFRVDTVVSRSSFMVLFHEFRNIYGVQSFDPIY